MGEEQAQSSLTESWRSVREQRKRMEVQVAHLSALEVAEFTRAARHIVEVAEELQAIAKLDHLPRLEVEAKRFAWAAGRAAEAAEQLELSLAREHLASAPSTELLPVTPPAATDAEMATVGSVDSVLEQRAGTDNGRVIKVRAKRR